MALRKLLRCAALCLVAGASALPQVPQPDALMQDTGTPGGPARLIFDKTPVLVNPGEKLPLDCGVAGKMRFCTWTNPAGDTIQVADVHEGLVQGLKAPEDLTDNQCGIVINRADYAHGRWTCKAFVVGTVLEGHKNVTVTVGPADPVLNTAMRPLAVNEDTKQEIECSVARARPSPQISWFLGQQDVTGASRQEDTADQHGVVSSRSILTHTFKPWNDKKTLRCEVNHSTLETPVFDIVDIEVLYKPYGPNANLYSLTAGQMVEAKLNFSANPKPLKVQWGYSEKMEDILPVLPVPGEEGSFTTEISALEDNKYMVILRIIDYQLEYSRLKFKVTVTNEQGSTDFQVVASSENPPVGEGSEVSEVEDSTINDTSSEGIVTRGSNPMATSTIAAIVVVLVVLLLVILCAIYMRYNKMYCFAERAESKAYIQDKGVDYPVGAHNSAVRLSTDQLNGNSEKALDAMTQQPNGKVTDIDSDYPAVPEEKINTAV